MRKSVIAAVAILGLGLGVLGLADSKKDPDSPETKESLDLRRKYHEFSRALKKAQEKAEDTAIAAERVFLDELRRTYRVAESEWAEMVAKAPDWQKAKREVDERRRGLERDLNQRLKVKREELELTAQRFKREQEDLYKKFSAEMDDRLADYRKDPDFRKAESDLRSLRDDARSMVQRFYDKMRGRRLQENSWK